MKHGYVGGYFVWIDKLEDGREIQWYDKEEYHLDKDVKRAEIHPDGSKAKWYKNGHKEYEKLSNGTERQWWDDGLLYYEKLPDGTERKWWGADQFWRAGTEYVQRYSLKEEKLPDGTERRWDNIWNKAATSSKWGIIAKALVKNEYEKGQLKYEKLPDGTEREWFDDGAPKFEKLPDGTVSKGYYIPQPNAVYIHEVYHVWETTYAHPIGRMTRITGGNYDVYDKARYGFRKEEEFFNGVIQSKTIYIDGKQAGIEKYENGKLVMSEINYKGKYEQHYYENGKLVMSEINYKGKYEQHYYDGEGKEISKAKYDKNKQVEAELKKMIKNIASKRIEKENAIEAKTGKKTRLPKMSKLEKTVAVAKEKLGLSK